MSNTTACLVGSLVGDGWMKLPGLCRLSERNNVDVVSGHYALPVWEWGLRHLQNAKYNIVEVIGDPDDHRCKFCPGLGHPAMIAALEFVRQQRPTENVIGGDQIETCYYKDTPQLQLNAEFEQGGWLCVHPYTKHHWKNLQDLLLKISYPRRVKLLGLPGEIREKRDGWEDLSLSTFDEQVAAVAGCRGLIGVGSSWSNVATLFHKPIIHVSYTADLKQFTNPKMTKLVTPTKDELQTEVNKWV